MDRAGGVAGTVFRDDAMAGRVCLITGGGSGIGFECARQFGLHGAKGVVLFGRRKNFLEDGVKLLQQQGVKGGVLAVAGDVRKSDNRGPRVIPCASRALYLRFGLTCSVNPQERSLRG